MTDRIGSMQARIMAGTIKNVYDEVTHWQAAHPHSGDTLATSLQYYLSRALEVAALMDQTRRSEEPR